MLQMAISFSWFETLIRMDITPPRTQHFHKLESAAVVVRQQAQHISSMPYPIASITLIENHPQHI
jgi:hypothetical protein